MLHDKISKTCSQITYISIRLFIEINFIANQPFICLQNEQFVASEVSLPRYNHYLREILSTNFFSYDQFYLTRLISSSSLVSSTLSESNEFRKVFHLTISNKAIWIFQESWFMIWTSMDVMDDIKTKTIHFGSKLMCKYYCNENSIPQYSYRKLYSLNL